MKGYVSGLVTGWLVAAIMHVISHIWLFTPPDAAYTKGVKDCREGKVYHTVIITPTGADTTYTYHE